MMLSSALSLFAIFYSVPDLHIFQGLFMFLFYCIGNEQYMDLWKAKFGIKTKKPPTTSSSAAAMGRSAVTTATRVEPPQPVVSVLPSQNYVTIRTFYDSVEFKQ